jgi:predicted NAD/FAD-binding protein
MKKLAIVGSGIAGLGCLYFLHRHYEITLFEKNAYVGGHTNTLEVEEAGQKLPVDTGFMVFNHVTYPNLKRLFDVLHVPTQTSDMSFSVNHEEMGLEWNGAGFNKLFGQRRNLLNFRFWKMLFQLNRFNQEAVANLQLPCLQQMSVHDYVQERQYGPDFLNLYLIPMSSAIWSTEPHKMLAFPAKTLLSFFYNHGFLGMDTHHQWYTVTGGSREYVKRILELTQPAIRLNQSVQGVERLVEGGVQIVSQQPNGEIAHERFDAVIMASHADQSLKMLSHPQPDEVALLGAFAYESKVATLHSDISVLPKSKRCWASWNYQIRPQPHTSSTHSTETLYDASTHYWMNSLQGISDQTPYIVTLNGEDRIDSTKIHHQIPYEHPIFNCAALAAQAELPQLNTYPKNGGVYFCGSYFRYGFHEDAFTSALDLARVLLQEEPQWPSP